MKRGIKGFEEMTHQGTLSLAGYYHLPICLLVVGGRNHGYLESQESPVTLSATHDNPETKDNQLS
jgi:hypothetical protein